MSELNVSRLSNITITGITTFTSSGSLKLPSGSNKERVGIESGSLRYNTTAKLFEFYDGTVWKYILPDNQANPIGVFNISDFKNIDNLEYVNITTRGNSQLFGYLSTSSMYGGISACSSTTRGVFGGGESATIAVSNVIQYITFSSKGNAIDFADFASNSWNWRGSCSSSTRGVFGGGLRSTPTPAYSSSIDYITIASNGNSTSFGATLSTNRGDIRGFSDSTRGIFAGGYTSPPSQRVNILDYITFQTTGQRIDFGDIVFSGNTNNATGLGTFGVSMPATGSSSTRGIIGSGLIGSNTNPANDISSYIDYVTIQTTGNSLYFGDLTIIKSACDGASSSTRCIFTGGYASYFDVVYTNVIDYITIATLGNSVLFGNMTFRGGYITAISNNHGGLL